MDAQQALADLTEISSQIQAAVVFDEQGKVAAATVDEIRADALAEGAGRLLEQAEQVKLGGASPLVQLEAATDAGSVFVVADGPRRIAATTAPDPTVGLVFYDLKSALRSIGVKQPARKVTPKKPAAKRPVRASGPEEGASGEPGGSPAPSARKKTTSAKKTASRRKKTDAS
jgi:predicted regulator of Ras-like GTPase activity (Roadblock/LC7/MglB family)